MKNKLAVLIRKEVARRSLWASGVVFFIALIAFCFAFGIKSGAPIIRIAALFSIMTMLLRVYYSKKILGPHLTYSNWLKLKMTHWGNAFLWAIIFCTAIFEMDNNSPHYFILFAMLAGFVANSLFTSAIDASIFLPTQILILAPLIAVALYDITHFRGANSLYLLFAYAIYLFYSLTQFKFIKKQTISGLQSQLEIENSNSELHKNEKQRKYFLELVLNLLSKKAPLTVIFETLIQFFETINEGTVCSILLLNKSKTHFEKVYAPGLPEFYNNAIAALDIGPTTGSCGTAAFTGQRTIVEDIYSSLYWKPYVELARAADISACWSQPIKDSKGEVLGTFAIYNRSPQVPSTKDIQLIEQAAELVSIVIQHFETESIASKAQEQVSLIYNSSIDPMWLIDVEPENNYRFKSINDSFTLVTGLTKDLVLEKTIEEVLPASSIELVRSKYSEAVRTGKVVDYLEIAKLPNGEKVGQIRVKPIKNDEGIVTKILGIAEDITEKKALDDLLKEREADLIYAQHIAQLGSWKWEAKNDHVFWSKEVYEMLEQDPDKPALPFSEQSNLYTEESWNLLKTKVEEALKDGTPYEVDLERKSKNKKYQWFFARGGVIEKDENGNIVRLAGTIQNITERKKMENDLKAALKGRDEFIAVASHELKTPLTTMQLALYGIDKILNENKIENDKLVTKLDKVKVQSERLEALIKNLLDVARIGVGKLEMDLKSNVNFSMLIENVTKKYEEEIYKTGSTLIKKIEPEIYGLWDEFRLEQIITNLLTNAMKYGNGKPIEIFLKREGNMAVLQVKDQGIGIAPDMQEKIFERFERAVSEIHYKGLGLGLWIVKEIVSAFQGEIRVQSKEGEGSTFTVELPIKGMK